MVDLPGLAGWVHSVPAGPDDAGGDVHYLSVCPSCIVSRIALVDVSGHGPAVKALGEKLQELMQRYLLALEQVGLMRDLNQAVRDELDAVHYATMVALGWHGRRGLLVVTNAGHPPPLWHRAARDEWSWLETQRVGKRVGHWDTFAYANDILGPVLAWCKHDSPSHLRTAVEGPYTARDQDAEAGVRSG